MQPELLHPRALPALTLASLSLCSTALAGGGKNGMTERILFAPGGAQLTEDAWITDVSADGRYAIFHTLESLAPADTNAAADVYRLDRATGQILCASVTALGAVGNGASRRGKVSDDGRYVVFDTEATNLVSFDTNGESDVLRKDFVTGQLQRMSQAIGSPKAANGESGVPDISADGRYVVFQSDAVDLDPATVDGVSHVYWRDTAHDALQRLSTGIFGEPTLSSAGASISADGLRVAFMSQAALLLPDTNGEPDVYVQDIGGQRKLVSNGPGGVQGDGPSTVPFLSADGDWVAYHSYAENLDTGDGNGHMDVYATHVSTGFTVLVSQEPDGTSGTGDSYVIGISSSGQFVVFGSAVGSLTPSFSFLPSIYVRDVEHQSTALVSRPTGLSSLPNGSSWAAATNAYATEVLFSSFASNLDAGDTNGAADVFARSLLADPTDYCYSSTTSAGCHPAIGWSGVPSASHDSGFSITASDVPNNKVGVLFYSLQGRDQVPFLGGALCTGPLAGRSPGLFSAGNPGISDCSGSYTIDMNAFAAGALGGAPHPALAQIGQQVNAQFWGRDPEGAVHTSFLSDALEYFVGP